MSDYGDDDHFGGYEETFDADNYDYVDQDNLLQDAPREGETDAHAPNGQDPVNPHTEVIASAGGDVAATATVSGRKAGKAVPKEKRTTTPYMTKYEKARLLGTRALQISMNAPVLVDLEGETDPLQIAMKELSQKKIPLLVRRYLPDGSYEDWACSELIVE
ncbi:DNA-directed RNA polymerase I, II, and III subunit Rpb6 [Saitoella complicata NRRL Y-17804]|uniref:DNA-directed RNA polymerases I, II, and III subunit RPABC2 n=1 Tax=Saitoella complicata (strain BCRC 22490 / CBS 7301 / JCM 7358 / NBRC 10748 / NRRL Y-17804) TaxID=698492 RepID=A0A0E9N9N5_SAICN|nr:DNA-directed RNA polymerase I, II, and III subunit Rpb6 [Saitoella complicata NRRL Y-17804]ODQ51354.1 DNA-directed RNA polymerase I, II, and III subunit Rpb6 [Saitoella complicata NRRL Y-17804]GAO46602.1 hypothetical protein G7K_0829-t1 [Saitoella complicata NRRL Y-17804]